MSAGLTQQALSEKAGVSRVSINSIENGVYVPSAVLALKIARVPFVLFNGLLFGLFDFLKNVRLC